MLFNLNQGCHVFETGGNFLFLNTLFLERGGGRQGEKHQHVVASHAPATGDLACNPGLCPDWELNRDPLVRSLRSVH